MVEEGKIEEVEEEGRVEEEEEGREEVEEGREEVRVDWIGGFLNMFLYDDTVLLPTSTGATLSS